MSPKLEDEIHQTWADLGLIVIDLSQLMERIQTVRKTLKRLENQK